MYRQTLCACLLIVGVSSAPTSAQDVLSTSIMRPTVLGADAGVIAGRLPGGDSARTFYVALDLKTGDLLAQLSVEVALIRKRSSLWSCSGLTRAPNTHTT